jgi:predicted nucleotidyltransferase
LDFTSRLFGVKVDLVSRKALKPHIGKRILEEVTFIF